MGVGGDVGAFVALESRQEVECLRRCIFSPLVVVVVANLFDFFVVSLHLCACVFSVVRVAAIFSMEPISTRRTEEQTESLPI